MSFWQGKAKIRPTDMQFSKYIRKRDGMCVFNKKCEKAIAEEYQGDEEYLKKLTNSHFYGRRKESTRFDEENCDTACRACHMYYEEHKEEYREWKMKQLGDKRFNALVLRANTAGHRDDVMQKIINAQLLKSL